jgi:large subunit ribosomal protein L29
MKATKVRELDSNEIASQLKEQEEQRFRLRLQIGMGQTEGLKKYRSLRKDRARMLTIQRERELAAAQAGAKK